MNQKEKKLAHHQLQASRWTATAQRTAGINTTWHFRALRQANWHALQAIDLQAELNGWMDIRGVDC